MAGTELQEVQALLERVLPDPKGFAQRLLLQVMTQFGQSAEANSGSFDARAKAFYTAATGDDVPADHIVVKPEPPTADEGRGSTNLLLAAALGACECWGLRADCDVCQGHGMAGWTEPVPELFYEFVGPAIARLPDLLADDLVPSASADSDHHDQSSS
jgi:hypothetical protein